MKKICCLLSVSALLFGLSSCDDEAYDVRLGAQRDTAPVTLHAVRYDSHRGVDSAVVEVVGRGLVIPVDASGCATFELAVGDYELRVSRRGYLPVIENVSVTLANDGSDVPVVSARTLDVNLHPLTASAKGYVTRIAEENDRRYQSGAIVRIELTDIETDMVFETRTDDEGAYRIDSLPEGASLFCKAEWYDGGAVYSGSQELSPLFSEAQSGLPTIAMTREEYSCSYDILAMPETPTGALSLTFPVAADVDAIRIDQILVLDREERQVGVLASWSDGDRVLNIRSADPKGWRTGSTEDYTFSVNVPNVEGGRLTASGTFGIATRTGRLAVVRSEYDPATGMITWPLLENALSYKIYVADSDDNDYVVKDNFAPEDGLTGEYPVKSLIDVNERKVYYVKVVGVNSQYEGDLAAAKELTIAHINPYPVFYESNTNTLHWQSVGCATAYRIYLKRQGADTYSLESTVSASADNSGEMSLSIFSIIDRGDYGTYFVKVVGVMENVSGNVNSAEEVEIPYYYY